MNFNLIAEQWDRIGQFYAAFPAGYTTASAALQRLNRFQASNRFNVFLYDEIKIDPAKLRVQGR